MTSNTFNDFIYVYSPGARADNPLGTNFWCQQKAIITLPISYKFKKICFEVWFYIHFFYVSPYVHSPGRGRQFTGDKILKTTERPFLFVHMLQVSKWSLRNLILYTFLMILYRYIALGQVWRVILLMIGYHKEPITTGSITKRCKVVFWYDIRQNV